MRHLPPLLSFFLAAPFAWGDILHLELGAANYHTPNQQAPTTKKFKVLELIALELVELYGPRGVIYLNDRNTQGLQAAESHLRAFLDARGYTEVTIQLRPGDFNKIELPRVKSMNLTNPGRSMLPSYGDPIFEMLMEMELEMNPKIEATLEHLANNETVKNLTRLARKSQTGVAINTYFFGSLMRLQSMLPKDYSIIHLGTGLPYYDVTGTKIASDEDPERFRLVYTGDLFQREGKPTRCMVFL